MEETQDKASVRRECKREQERLVTRVKLEEISSDEIRRGKGKG